MERRKRNFDTGEITWGAGFSDVAAKMKDGMKVYLDNYLKPKKRTYLKEHHEVEQTTSVNSFFRISTGIRKPRHVFVWVVRTGYYNNQQQNPFLFNTFKIGANDRYFTKAQLELVNSVYYPQLDFTSTEVSRLYRALMSYSSAYNDFLPGSLINTKIFKDLFG